MTAATLPLPGSKPARKRAPKKAPMPEAVPSDNLGRYALAGVVVMSGLSAGLNGYANALHASESLAGWTMGLVVPGIILILGKVAGLLWKRGFSALAYATAGAGAGLLLLSVWHCSMSISLLTGSPLLLALPMAVAIDVGFVCCEVSILVSE